MSFKLKPSRLQRRRKLIEDGIAAAAKWSQPVRDEYLDKGRMDILHDEALDDTFRHDMLKAIKAKTLMGKIAAKRRMG